MQFEIKKYLGVDWFWCFVHRLFFELYVSHIRAEKVDRRELVSIYRRLPRTAEQEHILRHCWMVECISSATRMHRQMRLGWTMRKSYIVLGGWAVVIRMGTREDGRYYWPNLFTMWRTDHYNVNLFLIKVVCRMLLVCPAYWRPTVG